MKATDVVKSWKDLSGFIYDRVSGSNKEHFSESDWELIDTEGSKVLKDVGVDELSAKSKKVMSLNILDKKVSFKVFEKIPNIWKCYFGTVVDLAAAEFGYRL